MTSTTRARQLAVALSLLLAAAAGSAAEEAGVPTYQALYEAEYKGRSVGRSEHTVTYDAERNAYRFETSTRPKGLARLLLGSRPVVERSKFVVEDGRLVPLEFVFEDGTRKGEEDVRIEFDWSRGEAAVTTANGGREMALANGVLDRATMQLALMRDLAADESPGPYVLADEESLETYRFSLDGSETTITESGTYDALKLTQWREGSSRQTVWWVAPALSYLPVRVEGRRDGETEWALILESVQGL